MISTQHHHATVGKEPWRSRSSAPRSSTGSTSSVRSARSRPATAAASQDVMTRNRVVRTPRSIAVAPGSVTVVINVVGVKFRCLVEKAWPCESLIASAIAEYHLAFPSCEIPDFTHIFHCGRKEVVPKSDTIGGWCRDGDELELGNAEPANAAPDADEMASGETYDFTVLFHRLPLGFTMKQENDNTVVAKIYPNSSATFYERLQPGVTVVKIADTPLEYLGLRQVHELVRTAVIPLEICFRGWRKPSQSLRSVVSPLPAPKSLTPARRKSVPSAPLSNGTTTRSRSSTTPVAATADSQSANNMAIAFTGMSTATKIPHSNSANKQRMASERKKTNAASPYPERRTSVAEKRSVERIRRESQEDLADYNLLKSLEHCDNQSQQGEDLDGTLSPVQGNHRLDIDEHMNHLAISPISPSPESEEMAAATLKTNGELHHEEPLDVRNCDVDSNQNDEETEEMMVEHIKELQLALIKKHEEAKQIARELERYHDKLSVSRAKHSSTPETVTHSPPAPTSSSSLSGTRPRSVSSTAKVRLTPEVLEAMDSKAGLPPKNGFYTGSNASSVSGYSNYSTQSAAVRSSRYGRVSSRVGGGEQHHFRSDMSVSSYTSVTSDRRALKSPRSRSGSSKNIQDRYSYIPTKYSTPTTSYDAPTSLSSKGAVIGRAKTPRDSFITKSESPGVGSYNVKVVEKVKGGEIGDSDRVLPWS